MSGTARASAIRLGPRTAVVLTLAGLIGVAVFAWPFLIDPARLGGVRTAPLALTVLLLLVLAVLVAEISEGGIDAKALALLGVLSAVNAGLRPLGAGTAGIETVFFLLVLAGRVMGPGFGFTLGCTSLFASALITGGVGPWVPFQMFGCAFVGLGAGLLPRLRGRAEIALLAGYGAVTGYVYGFLLNLSTWPFSLGGESAISFHPGDGAAANLGRYVLYDATTSLGWDTGRAVTTAVLVALVGPAVLGALRRASRRAAFGAPVVFADSADSPPGAAAYPPGGDRDDAIRPEGDTASGNAAGRTSVDRDSADRGA